MALLKLIWISWGKIGKIVPLKMISELEGHYQGRNSGKTTSQIIETTVTWREFLSSGKVYPTLTGFWCSQFDPEERLLSDCQECIRLRHISEISVPPEVERIVTSPVGFRSGNYLYLDSFSLRYLIEKHFREQKVSGVVTHLWGYLCGRVGHLIYSPSSDKSSRLSLDQIREGLSALRPYHYSFISDPILVSTDPFQFRVSTLAGINIGSVRLLPHGYPPSYLPEPLIVEKKDYFYLRTFDSTRARELITQRIRGDLKSYLNANLNLIIIVIHFRNRLSDSDWARIWINPPSRSQFDSIKRLEDLLIQLNRFQFQYIYSPKNET